MKSKNEILVILTGGTICSAPNEHAKNQSDAESAKNYIIADFEESDSPYAKTVHFNPVKLVPDILSENMTTNAWNHLLDILRNDEVWKGYAGVITLHGTDTLAYTASLLSTLLAGAPIPVCMVSAQLPLRTTDGKKETRTNGYANFRAATELIMNGIAPNVYAVYRNMDGRMLVHYGAHLKQCPNYSCDFDSVTKTEVTDLSNARTEGTAFKTNGFLLKQIDTLSPDVLLITPYVGMKYSRLCLDGVAAIVHGTYHSDTICVERKNDSESYGDFSILSLLDRCKPLGIPVYLAPCDSAAYAYDSTGDALRNGAQWIARTTFELAYTKTLVGCSLGLKGDRLTEFLHSDINGEFVY